MKASRALSVIGETVFTTKRLRLEPLVEAHAAKLFKLYSDPEMWKFVPQEPFVSLETLADRFGFLEARKSPKGDELWFNWAIRLKLEGTCIGCVQITLRHDTRAQIAYEIGVPLWRQGFATEACQVVIEALFAAGVVVVWAELDTRNAASMRLLEKLGFRRGALKANADVFKGSVSHEWTYSLINPKIDDRP